MKKRPDLEEESVEQRIDRYVRDYSARTLAEMLVELEDKYTERLGRKRLTLPKFKP